MNNPTTNINLKARLQELPKAAYDRITSDSVGISHSAFYAIVRGDYIPTVSVIRKFCRILKCSTDEFLDPKYRFTDFRSAKQIKEDQAPQ